MCGILGVIGQVDDLSAQVVKRALNVIAHRGPDGEGILRSPQAILGHRRLAIIDLTSGGSQPMTDPESSLSIVFNGEIYNYLEVREELARAGTKFVSSSDTEVLLKGYREWGEDVLNKCNGMWSFVIWDANKRRAFISRDRFGKKPLYYAISGNRLIFASEPKAIHAIDPALTAPNTNAIVNLLVKSCIHAGCESFYRDIHALPPGHCAVYDASSGHFQAKRYWDYPCKRRERRRQSVRRRRISVSVRGCRSIKTEERRSCRTDLIRRARFFGGTRSSGQGQIRIVALLHIRVFGHAAGRTEMG